jgi:hypothetical protein
MMKEVIENDETRKSFSLRQLFESRPHGVGDMIPAIGCCRLWSFDRRPCGGGDGWRDSVTTPAVATSISIPVSVLSTLTVQTFQDERIVRSKNDKDKGQSKANTNKLKKAKSGKK